MQLHDELELKVSSERRSQKYSGELISGEQVNSSPTRSWKQSKR